MALSNLFGWKRKQKQKPVQHAEQRVEHQTNRKAQIVRGTIALSGPERSVDNQQHAEQHVEHQTSRRRNRQHAEQHVEHLTSKTS